jgi:hypothetical protein
MPIKSFKIIKRSSTKPPSECAIDFGDRNYKIPLCGCGGFNEQVKVGDVVGVKLSSNICRREVFKTSSELIPEAKWSIIPERQGNYRPEEEHLFIITKINTKSKFCVQPYFLDSDKVIIKQVDEQFASEWSLPVSEIDNHTLCEFVFESKYKGLVTEEFDYLKT